MLLLLLLLPLSRSFYGMAPKPGPFV